MPDRRFRDMRLTGRELDDALQWMLRDCYLRNIQSANGRRGLDATLYLDRLEARAKRLLPLWRDWGLRDLYRQGISDDADWVERTSYDV